MKTAALGLWEGLSHSASLRSNKSCLTPLRCVRQFVGARTKLAGTKILTTSLKLLDTAKTKLAGMNSDYEFNFTTSLLFHQNYEFKKLLA